MTKRFAFTLAEVLIALAIIGVVAAMTIPTFMANTAGAQFRTGFKKGITVLTQAAAANYATEGYDFGGTNVAYGADSATPTATTSTPITDAYARIGFETTAPATIGNHLDLEKDVQSLFHLFQGNLNMKNSNEVVNYDVGRPDIALNCDNTTTLGSVATDNFKSRLTLQGISSSAPGAARKATGGILDLCGGRALDTDGTKGINMGRMFMLEDGMVFTYDAGQSSCTEGNPCFGYIDVNGPQGPNKVISCSTGDNALIRKYDAESGNDATLLSTNCTVDAKDITDIYPVLFYNSTVKPASLAAKAVLYSQKSNQ